MWRMRYSLFITCLCSPALFITVVSQVTLPPPRLQTEPENITAMMGEDAVLPCFGENLHTTQVIFARPSKRLTISVGLAMKTSNTRMSVSNPYDGEWLLTIKDVNPHDMGTYVCMINTQPQQHKMMRLYVRVPPIINDASFDSSYMRPEGAPLNITCQAVGLPRPTVIWYKLHMNSPQDDNPSATVVSNSNILTIPSLSRSHSGIYRCEAKSSLPPKAMKDMVLKVMYKPTIMITEEEVLGTKSTSVYLSCSGIGFPLPVMSWERNKQIIQPNFKYSVNVYPENKTMNLIDLEIRYVEMADSGEYTCVAQNAAGPNVTRTVTLTVVEFTTTENVVTKKRTPLTLEGTKSSTQAPKEPEKVMVTTPENGVESHYKLNLSTVLFFFLLTLIHNYE